MEQWKVRHNKAMFSLKRTERGAGLYDYDGREYQSVIIGSQEWLTSGYSPIHYADGTIIPHLPDSGDWVAATEGAWCYYDNDQENLSIYGRLYNQYAKDDAHGFVYIERGDIHEPEWRVPSQADFLALFLELGGINISGGKMKEAGTSHWTSPNVGATNSTGLYVRGGGYRSDAGIFVGLGDLCFMITSDVYSYFLEYSGSAAIGWSPTNGEGMYVRLVRDI